jgi:3-deoxy-7-phosphoheptulonate synthase
LVLLFACHFLLVILPSFRGSGRTAIVDTACKEICKAGIAARLMVDFSHGNSRKQYKLQMEACDSVAAQMAAGEERIVDVMVESHLVEGRQDTVLDKLATAVRARRVAEAAE